MRRRLRQGEEETAEAVLPLESRREIVLLRFVSTDKLILNTSNTHDKRFCSASRQKSVQFTGTWQQKAPCWLNKSSAVLCESDCSMLLAAHKHSSTRPTVPYFLSSLSTKCFVYVPLTPQTALPPSPLHRGLPRAGWSTGLKKCRGFHQHLNPGTLEDMITVLTVTKHV